jgi:hypothetical protein
MEQDVGGGPVRQNNIPDRPSGSVPVAVEPTGLEHVTPVKLRAVSATERASFRRCRRQWFLTQAHRLESAGEVNENFWLGELVHSALEDYYAAQREGLDEAAREAAALSAYDAAAGEAVGKVREEMGAVWSYAKAHWEELRDKGRAMAEAYLAREREDPLVDEVVEVEVRRFIPIRDPRGRAVGKLSVRTDLVGRRDGVLCTVDHKTASSKMPKAQLDIDDQLTAEAYIVWRDLGEFPEQVGYNALLKKVPAPPKRLKDGKGGMPKLSRDRDQPTTFELYMDEIGRLGLDEEDYREHLDWLLEREWPFGYREWTFRTPGQMASFEANLYQEFRDMRAVAADPARAYPNPSHFACPSCPVRAVCTAMMDGSDAGHLISTQYQVADPRY